MSEARFSIGEFDKTEHQPVTLEGMEEVMGQVWQ